MRGMCSLLGVTFCVSLIRLDRGAGRYQERKKMRKMNKTLIMTLARGIYVALLLVTPSVYAAGGPDIAPTPKLAIQLGAPFCDNAVLQRDVEVPVWGWSKPGTAITVAFAGQSVTATAGQDGKWVAKLAKLKASFEPADMVITESTNLRQGSGGQAGTKVVLQNILVGEVWMASGQSNMQWTSNKSSCNKLAVALLDLKKA